MSNYYSSIKTKVLFPKECCCCNTALGTESYHLKTSSQIGNLEKSYSIDVPVCKSCLHEISKKETIGSIIGLIIGALGIGIPLFLVFQFNIWLLPIMIFVVAIVGEIIFIGRFIEPIKPALLDNEGNLFFQRNEQYDKRYRELNSLPPNPSLKGIGLELQEIVAAKKELPTVFQDQEILSWKIGFSRIGWLEEIGKKTQNVLSESSEIFDVTPKNLLCTTYFNVSGSHITRLLYNQIDLSSEFTAYLTSTTNMVFVQPKDKIVRVINYKDIDKIESNTDHNQKTYLITTISGDMATIVVDIGKKDDAAVIDAYFARIACTK